MEEEVKTEEALEKEPKAKEPLNPLIILAIILVVMALLTYIIPAGEFDRTPVEGQDYEMIDVDSFHYIDRNPTKPFDLFKAFTLGLQDASYIIFFLLIIGGAFQIVTATGAIDSGLSNLVAKMRGHEIIFIPVCVIMFSIISGVAACCEEYLAFIPLMYVACIAMGFDSLTAVALLLGSSAVGYAGGMMNAFTVGTAQTIAGLKMFSGMGVRWAVWALVACITIIYVMHHAMTIKNHPEKNYMAKIDQKYAENIDVKDPEPITTKQKLVLVIFALTFVIIAVGIVLQKVDWWMEKFPDYELYIDEMAAIYIIMSIIVVIVSGMKVNKAVDEFVAGCGNLLWAGLIIGMCTAVTNVMKDAGIMDTLIHGMGTVLQGLPRGVNAIGMFVMQDLLNCLIPSGSGQAAVTMPFMAPLSDVLGIPRQCAVLAFQMGDAFTNVITPTSGELMAALAICHIPYSKWFRFWGPLWGIWCVTASIIMVVAVSMGYN